MSDRAIIAAREGKSSLRVLAASALRAVLTAAAERYAQTRGGGFELSFGTSGAINRRAKDGEPFDLVASAREALADLVTEKLADASLLDIGVSKLALGVRKGEGAPDISSLEKFRQTLLDAHSISRGDPAGGGTAGNHLVKVFAQLGVSDDVAAKSILRAGGFAVMQEVVQGHADFGLTQSTEIPAVAGVEIGAFLPDGAQLVTVYSIAKGTAARAGAADFLLYLESGEARRIAAASGFDVARAAQDE